MMSRRIWLDKEDQDYQRLLWEEDSKEVILRILTVIYGISSSAYLATRTLVQVADDEAQVFPETHKIVKRDFYVDDLISVTHSIEEAIKIQDELMELLKRGNFMLRKWSSNDERLLTRLPQELRETQIPLEIGNTASVKALGILWNPATDTFNFQFKTPPDGTVNKRTILSILGTLFDPMGWMSPSIMKAKLFLQQAWTEGKDRRLKSKENKSSSSHTNLQHRKEDWEEPVSKELESSWKSYIKSLPALNEIEIPRYINYTPEEGIWELHGFCDASEIAYAACIYIRGIHKDGRITCNLLT